MQVITVTTDIFHEGFVNYLQSSCKLNDLNLIVLESEQPSLPTYRYKDIILNQHLDKIHDDEIIFFSDANDTAFLTSEDEILKKFNVFNTDLVFSAEVNCWPDMALKNKYNDVSHNFSFLNTGGFLGRAGYIKDIYKKYPVFTTAIGPFDWSNQYYWHHVYFNEYKNIKIDYDCDIFYNTAFLIENMEQFKNDLKLPKEVLRMIQTEQERLDNEIFFENNRIKCRLTGTTPCHLHFPGPISKSLCDNGYFTSLKFQ